MLKYEKWLQRPSKFISMTGYMPEDFQRLLPFFEEAHDGYLSRYEMNGQRKKGGRRYVMYQNSPLPSHAERLCFILFYLKHNPVQEVQAEMFDMDHRYCHTYIHGLRHILDLSLSKAGAMPSRSDEGLQSKIKELENKELIHDGTEREIPRPQNNDKQKDNYSGKKKRHTLKNAILASMTGIILFVSPTYEGRTHDLRMTASYSICSGTTLWQDTGYQGYRPQRVTIIQPTKKPKGQELTDEQKLLNRSISSIRVRIEHFIGGVKRYRIVKDECRAYKNGFRDGVIGTCSGLYNFRVIGKPPQYVDCQ